jgi:hypothetical protein
MSFICLSRRAFADPWSTQPLIGIIGQYASNPALLAEPKSETNAALVLNLPVNYDLESFHFVATPSVRYGNATGYSSVTSNYFHLDTKAQFTSDLSSTTFSGGLYRDSSLLYAGEIQNGVGVRRDTATADITWQRQLNELDLLQLDVNTIKTTFGQSDVPNVEDELVDYRYSSFSPAMLFALSERNSFRIIGGFGWYRALDGISESNSTSLQLGFDRQLSELWTLKTTAGYTKSTDQQKFYFEEFLLGTIKSTQNGTVYAANLIRQGELMTWNFGASRSLAPTGYAYLSRQQGANLLVSYNYSERWAFSSSINWQITNNPLNTGGSLEQRYIYATIAANWHWTEQWVVTLQAIKVAERYGQPQINGTSNGVSLQIARQFYRTDLK